MAAIELTARGGRGRRTRRRTTLLALGLLCALGIAAGPASAMTASVSQTGRFLTVTTNDPPALTFSYTYSWSRCSGSGNCTAVGSQQSLPLGSGDIGSTFRATVVARTVLGLGLDSATSPLFTVTARPPDMVVPPALVGGTAEGDTLTGSTGVFVDPTGGGVSYERGWYRCPAANSVTGCEDRAGDVSAITLGATDVGRYIRYRVVARAFGINTHDVVSGLVANKPGQPGGPGTPPGGNGGTGNGGTPNNGGSGNDTGSKSRFKKMRPFPGVVIAGRLSGGITRVTEFRVKGPRGAKVSVTCSGKRCPYKRAKTRTLGRKSLRLRNLQVFYGSGAVIKIKVTKKGLIGKYTEVRIRKGRAPARKDLCLEPGARKPTSCG